VKTSEPVAVSARREAAIFPPGLPYAPTFFYNVAVSYNGGVYDVQIMSTDDDDKIPFKCIKDGSSRETARSLGRRLEQIAKLAILEAV
jgi:hypothetical protein